MEISYYIVWLEEPSIPRISYLIVADERYFPGIVRKKHNKNHHLTLLFKVRILITSSYSDMCTLTDVVPDNQLSNGIV